MLCFIGRRNVIIVTQIMIRINSYKDKYTFRIENESEKHKKVIATKLIEF